jgi:cyclase
MDEDGRKDGYDLGLTRAVSEAVTIPVIASGGAGNAMHMRDVVIDGHADAVLAASIFHYGETSIASVKQFLQRSGLPMRLATGQRL